MKLPWDKNYLKISFHAIITIVGAYIIIQLFGYLGYALTNLTEIAEGLGSSVGWLLSAFSVLIMAFVIAYLMNPLVDFFQRKYDDLAKNSKRLAALKKRMEKNPAVLGLARFRKKTLFKNSEKKPTVFRRRTQGALLAYLCIFSIFFVLGMAIYLQVRVLNGNPLSLGFGFSVDSMQNGISEFYADLRTTFEEWGISDGLQNAISGFVNSVAQFFTELSSKLLPMVTSAGGKILDFMMALVVAFYLLRDKDAIRHKLTEVLFVTTPAKLYRTVMAALSDIHSVFSGYIIGQLTDALIMAILISAGLSVIGVNFAVIIGIISGFSNIVPYFGAIVGFLLSVIVALVSGNPSQAIQAAVVVIILQQIDGMFIVPKVVGNKVELNPALVILSLAVGGSMFGFAGLLFGVPACAALKIIGLKLYERLKQRKTLTGLPGSE